MTLLRRSKRMSLRKRMFTRQAGLCALCGSPMFATIEDQSLRFALATFDHIHPKADGGSHDESNLRMTHAACNSIRDRQNIVGVPLVLA